MSEEKRKELDDAPCCSRRYKSVQEMQEMIEGHRHPDGKKCPRCGAGLLKNKQGVEWCSHVDCDYDIEDNTNHIGGDSRRSMMRHVLTNQ